MHEQTTPNTIYKNALDWTDPKHFDLATISSNQENRRIEKVVALFSNYTEANLRNNLREVYADRVYFRDAFKQLASAEAVESYMLAGLKPLDQAEFVFNRVAVTEGNYYFDWTMRLDFKKTPQGSWEESIGISHMRFDLEDKVIFHQDYWDPTDIVYRRIPIAKQLISLVKSKL